MRSRTGKVYNFSGKSISFFFLPKILTPLILCRALKSPLSNRGLLMDTLLKRAKYSVGIKNKINIEGAVHPRLKVKCCLYLQTVHIPGTKYVYFLDKLKKAP